MPANALNPFIWDRPLDDPSKIVGMEPFANEVALILKAQTNVALFGPRDTGKTTFTNQLALELARTHGPDGPPCDVVKINLQRVGSIPGFIGCVRDAMLGHPVKQLRRAAQRQIGVLEKEFGFDIKVVKGMTRRSRRRKHDQPPAGNPLRLLEPFTRPAGARAPPTARARRSPRQNLVRRRPPFGEWLRRASPLADRPAFPDE